MYLHPRVGQGELVVFSDQWLAPIGTMPVTQGFLHVHMTSSVAPNCIAHCTPCSLISAKLQYDTDYTSIHTLFESVRMKFLRRSLTVRVACVKETRSTWSNVPDSQWEIFQAVHPPLPSISSPPCPSKIPNRTSYPIQSRHTLSLTTSITMCRMSSFDRLSSTPLRVHSSPVYGHDGKVCGRPDSYSR